MPFGKQVNEAEAKLYFDQYEKVHADHIVRGGKIFTDPPIGNPPLLAPASQYFRSEVNAFVFDIGEIGKLLINNPGTTHFVVHFAARLEDGEDAGGNKFQLNDPTIVITATKQESANVFSLINTGYSGLEQPGGKKIPENPIAGKTNVTFGVSYPG